MTQLYERGYKEFEKNKRVVCNGGDLLDIDSAEYMVSMEE
jgi:hypothetical protein